MASRGGGYPEVWEVSYEEVPTLLRKQIEVVKTHAPSLTEYLNCIILNRYLKGLSKFAYACLERKKLGHRDGICLTEPFAYLLLQREFFAKGLSIQKNYNRQKVLQLVLLEG